ncbi:zinc-dependent alcohol dehydrogenase family protein [Tengunoibacter tsumagoiensis]|uniref:NADPH:quinone oxidoreductase n=1 Tax=Tengunoibacter tsumagoiensis TaxID=2014871 RepID=A0A402AB11_9CHLR|nr:zinc-dependent alcohol dehydrogenase family protein [Tengunoibacter tsumagoiensis]GCE16131.1 NADPH:quinone oxidoreductase [Tengunoibacter tsumagoiensis]
MKAMLITGFGGPEVFQLQDVEKPRPEANEVLVKVYASSVNPVDYKIRQAGEWSGVKPPAVIGYDVSGVVEAIGPGVKDFKVGDEVFYTPDIPGRIGSYGEYHVAREAIVAHKPKNLSHLEAASIPLAGGTAWDAIITRAKLHVGETVLIHGGTGGVGSFAIQIARAAGAYVFTTCSEKNRDLAIQLGAHRAIDYTKENFIDVIQKETNGAGVDVVFDTVGRDTMARSIAITKIYGRIVGIVDTTGNLFPGFMKNITLELLFLQRERYKLDYLRALIERGQIKPHIDSVLPFEKVAEAHNRLEKGGVTGKIVLQVVK